MTRTSRRIARPHPLGSCARTAFALLVVPSVAVAAGLGASTATAVDTIVPPEGSYAVIVVPQQPVDDDGGGAPDRTLPSSEACTHHEEYVDVLASGGGAPGTVPVYGIGEVVNLAGGNWCAEGKPLQGERTLVLGLVQVDGYLARRELSVPVSFDEGRFEAAVDVAAAYTDLGARPGTYYLTVTVDSWLFADSSQFRIGDPEPSAQPTDAPAPAPDPSDPVEPEPSAQPTDVPAPAPAPDPSDPVDPEPVPEPTDAPDPAPSTAPAPGPVDPGEPVPPSAAPEASPEPETPQDTPSASPTPSPGPTASPSGPGAGQGNARPAGTPSAPVRDASQLDASNAGSLSGTRRGNVVSLILPSDKAQKDDWVAVFLFPGDTTPGWTQVGEDNSVSIDVSTLEAGTYQLAIGDRDSQLLGWAQLEIASVSGAAPAGGAMTATTSTVSGTSRLHRNDWVLAAAGGLLLVGGIAALVMTRPVTTGRTR